MTDIKSEQKVLVLRTEKLGDKKEELLHKYMFVVDYDSTLHKSMTAQELFARAQCVILDMRDVEQRKWLARQKNMIKSMGNIHTIYLAKTGDKCDMKKVKETYNATSVVKYLPDNAKSPQEFIQMILNDHIPNIDMGKLASIWVWLKNKVKGISICK